MQEECTPEYIAGVRELFCGRWVCGLCSEAVKEIMRKRRNIVILAPAAVLEEALASHTAFCEQFNRTTRLNPKLSLARSMRDIARKSSQHRSSGSGSGGGGGVPAPPRVARTITSSLRSACQFN
ncbi:hypothetical protein AXF42_Ash015728 [Apostasia shenzhenica]|uniref:Uncharacterized protein n=1 Tax=Apostasia shenzhenica TaxID=1088818 RepID=A0A2H9ZU68_9ASPA|nr:hypothetical protein AXF42_Ash015728 [Apostasia shenzhenica]